MADFTNSYLNNYYCFLSYRRCVCWCVCVCSPIKRLSSTPSCSSTRSTVSNRSIHKTRINLVLWNLSWPRNRRRSNSGTTSSSLFVSWDGGRRWSSHPYSVWWSASGVTITWWKMWKPIRWTIWSVRCGVQTSAWTISIRYFHSSRMASISWTPIRFAWLIIHIRRSSSALTPISKYYPNSIKRASVVDHRWRIFIEISAFCVVQVFKLLLPFPKMILVKFCTNLNMSSNILF